MNHCVILVDAHGSGGGGGGGGQAASALINCDERFQLKSVIKGTVFIGHAGNF